MSANSAKQVSEYFDGWTDSGGYPIYEPSLYGKILRQCEALRTPGRRVIDIGCGVGLVSAHIKNMGHHVTGVDLSQKAIEEGLAQGRMDEGYAEDFGQFSPRGGAYDVAVFWGACMFPDLPAILAQTARILADDGQILLMDHNPKNPYIWAAFNRPRWVEKVIEGTDRLNYYPVRPKKVIQSTEGVFEWDRPSYLSAFTRHPNFVINTAHTVAEFSFKCLGLVTPKSFAGNLLVLTGKKSGSNAS